MNQRRETLRFIDNEYNSYILYDKNPVIEEGEALLHTVREGHYFTHELTYKINGELKVIKGTVKDLILEDKKLEKKVLEIIMPTVESILTA